MQWQKILTQFLSTWKIRRISDAVVTWIQSFFTKTSLSSIKYCVEIHALYLNDVISIQSYPVPSILMPYFSWCESKLAINIWPTFVSLSLVGCIATIIQTNLHLLFCFFRCSLFCWPRYLFVFLYICKYKWISRPGGWEAWRAVSFNSDRHPPSTHSFRYGCNYFVFHQQFLLETAISSF